MNRLDVLLAVVLLGLTVPLGRLVYKDVLALRVEAMRVESLAPPNGFRGRTLAGESFLFDDGPKGSLVGLFVLRSERLKPEIARWNALQRELAPFGVELIGTCDHSDCASSLGGQPAGQEFTVLAAVTFMQAHSLAKLDAEGGWLLCERSGRIRGVMDVPKDDVDVERVAESVRRSLAEVQHAPSS